MKDYKPRLDKDTNRWMVLKKEMNQFSGFWWVIEATGLLSKKDALEHIEKLRNMYP